MATTITGDTITVGNSTIRSADNFDTTEGVIDEIVTNANGTAIKYSNGLLVNYMNINTTVNVASTTTGSHTFPVAFISEPFGYQYMQTVQHGDPNFGKAQIWRYGSSNNAVFDFAAHPESSAASGYTVGVTFSVTVTGYWK